MLKKEVRKKKSVYRITLAQIALLGIHYGDEFRLTNSSCTEWIYGKRLGKIILDIRYTFIQWKKSVFFLSNILSLRGKMLYLDLLSDFIDYKNFLNYFRLLGQSYIYGEFSTGILSNFRYIYFEVFRSFALSYLKAKMNVISLSKNKKKIFNEERIREIKEHSLEQYLGLKGLRRIPNIVFIPDTERNFWTYKSTVRIRIPSISLVTPLFFVDGSILPVPGKPNNTTAFSALVFMLLSISLKGVLMELKKFFRVLKRIHKFYQTKKRRRFFKKKFVFEKYLKKFKYYKKKKKYDKKKKSSLRFHKKISM